MDEVNISRDQQRALIEHGICGSPPDAMKLPKFSLGEIKTLNFTEMRQLGQFSRIPSELVNYTKDQWSTLKTQMSDGQFQSLKSYIEAAQNQRKVLERTLSDIGVPTSDEDLARLIMRRGRLSSEHTGLRNGQ